MFSLSNILGLILVTVFALVVVPFLALILYQFARSVEKPLFEYFDSRWCRGNNLVRLAPGDRLACVLIPDKRAHVWWDVFDGIRRLIGFVLIVGYVLFFLAPTIQVVTAILVPELSAMEVEIGLRIVIFAVLLVATVCYIPYVYWLSEWQRIRTKFIVTIRATYIFIPKPHLKSLFLPQADPAYSDNESTELKKVHAMADPEDLGGNRHTGPLEETWLRYLAGSSEAVLTLMFPESYRGPRALTSADLLYSFANALMVRSILIKIAEMSEAMTSSRSFVARASVDAMLPKTAANYNRSTALRAHLEMQNALDRAGLFTHSPLIDLVHVVDPGHCDFKQGTMDPNFTVATAVLGDVQPEEVAEMKKGSADSTSSPTYSSSPEANDMIDV